MGPAAIAAPVFMHRCPYCTRIRSIREFVHFGEHVLICWRCYEEKHTPAVEGYNPPHECAECRRNFEQIAADSLGNRVSMFTHWKDGIYQLICARCDRKYVEQRKDLFGATPFGYHKRKL